MSAARRFTAALVSQFGRLIKSCCLIAAYSLATSTANADPQTGRIYRKIASSYFDTLASRPLTLDQAIRSVRLNKQQRDSIFLFSPYTDSCEAVMLGLDNRLETATWTKCPLSNEEAPPVVLRGREEDAVVAPDLASASLIVHKPQSNLRFGTFSIPLPYPPSSLITGDVNGDGLQDILVFSNESGIFSVIYAPLTAESRAFEAGYLNPARSWDFIVSGDWNGDGRDDLAAMEISARSFDNPGYQWWYLLASANGWFTQRPVEVFSRNRWGRPAVVRLASTGADAVIVPELNQGAWYLLRETPALDHSLMSIVGGATPPANVTSLRGPVSAEEFDELVLLHSNRRAVSVLQMPLVEQFTLIQNLTALPFVVQHLEIAELNGGGPREIIATDANTMYLLSLHAVEPLANVALPTFSGEIIRTDPTGKFTRQLPPGENLQVKPFGYEVLNQLKFVNVSPGDASVIYVVQESADAEVPKVCTGYDFRTGQWGRGSLACPPHYAFIEVDNIQLEENLAGICCPLPRKDILSGKEVQAMKQCPPNHIAIGLTSVGTPGRKLRCAEVSSGKYLLSEPRPGAYWGLGSRGVGTVQGLVREQLPAGIRYAVGRMNVRTWDTDGCLGQPPGSVLVGKLGKDCKDDLFSSILEIDRDGSFKPIKIFPDCRRISDPLDPHAFCF